MEDQNAYEGIEGNDQHSFLGNEAVAAQSQQFASNNPANPQPGNNNLPNNDNVIGYQPGGALNQAVIVQPQQGDDDIDPEIPLLSDEVRAALIEIANSNPPVDIRTVDPELLRAIIADVARMLHARNGRCRHVDEVTGEQCPARRWKAGARKCMSHLKRHPSVETQLKILMRQMEGHGTCSGNYAWKEREDGRLCDGCRRKDALRRERAGM
ncbi:hypothetical protein NEUTE1DRAFT_42884 [Neurospora tetrasperma FGSC 2508]|uniref:Uncharacterized protein n=1 Tax=Neurospora tetrasperma (strain FGSC 2508 / ATCC MYA-4615 / P0657) TaxID=510951 RepID=F8MLA1_NEUT8|nr:uncharacterized protein NEUTE1DRAFT_42884 [Neurospora tetrasperma FGSC 2508]EGO58374.1 hypothetical protein NEUTE1DRAFT_42884 [Neurospora tetrasperma FGSC 2508]EGZ71299.1 hypothetical protein NEUTE2DRAFT_65550 [Neurospora tetrasperma FGSC 2509]